MKKALLMSSLMVAFAAAGLNADTHDTDVMEQDDGMQQEGMEQEDPMMEEENGLMEEDDGLMNGEDDFDHAQVFMELDTDGDGVISREEAEQADQYPELAEQFDELDEDGDGVLTMEEFEEFDPENGETW